MPDDSPDRWKDKYLDAVDRLEREQARWERTDASLRRAIGRLSIACRGLDNRLDEELAELGKTIRQKVEAEALDRRIDALSEAIVALDESPAAPAFTPTPGLLANTQPEPADHGAGLLGELIARLQGDAVLAKALEELKDRIAPGSSAEALREVAASLADLLNQQQQRLQQEKLSLEGLLGQVDSRLDEFAVYLLQDRDARKDERASHSDFSERLHGEVDHLGRQTRQATELEQLKSQVSSRLTAINSHVQDFRTREEQRIARLEERGDAMRLRIDELERETSHLRQSLQVEQQLAATDPLTRIPNRLAYEQEVQLEFNRWQRFRRPVALAVWDIDEFKAINDRFGHKAGDKVLFAVAQVLRKQLRSTDFVARVGGEEFVMLLPGADPEQARRLCEELRRKVSALGFHFGGTPVRITSSVGITDFRIEDTPDTAFERADAALYRAKKAGRDRVEAD